MKTLKLSDISKKYNDITVLANANAEFTSSKITWTIRRWKDDTA